MSMTADQIDNLTPDELNRWIAEREGYSDSAIKNDDHPRYTHSADAAIALCERLGIKWIFGCTGSGTYTARVKRDGTFDAAEEVTADTPAHALAKAAAKRMVREGA